MPSPSLLYVLGPAGTYSDQMRRRVAPDHPEVDDLSRTVEEVVQRTVAGEAYGVLPVMNTYGGYVTPAIRALVENMDLLRVIGSKSMKIHHILCTRDRWKNARPKRIFSHPQALKQCADRLMSTYSEAQKVQVGSTAAGCDELVMPGDCVICSSEAAQKHNLHILDSEITPDDNRTTFVIIATQNAAGIQLQDVGHDIGIGYVEADDFLETPDEGELLMGLLGGHVVDFMGIQEVSSSDHIFFPFVARDLEEEKVLKYNLYAAIFGLRTRVEMMESSIV